MKEKKPATPLLRQFYEIKAQYPGSLLLYSCLLYTSLLFVVQNLEEYLRGDVVGKIADN